MELSLNHLIPISSVYKYLPCKNSACCKVLAIHYFNVCQIPRNMVIDWKFKQLKTFMRKDNNSKCLRGFYATQVHIVVATKIFNEIHKEQRWLRKYDKIQSKNIDSCDWAWMKNISCHFISEFYPKSTNFHPWTKTG